MKKKRMTPAAAAALSNGDIENFIAATTPGGIERQEANGQFEFVMSESLPAAGTVLEKFRGELPDRKTLTDLGFVFGAVNGLFVQCKLPNGWKKRATDHSMWSELLDDKGRKRAAIFYKAAFYDREAFIRWESPLAQNSFLAGGKETYEHQDGEKTTMYGLVSLHGKEVFRTEAIEIQTTKSRWQAGDEIRKLLDVWINENYPDHRNPFAYWETTTA
jgi:hypothetical protein